MLRVWKHVGMAILMVFASVAAAQESKAVDITGTWLGQMSTGLGGTIPLKFQFKVEGRKLTGRVIVNNGEQDIALYNGRIEGDKISFKVEGDTPDYTGNIQSDKVIEIKATMRGERGTRTNTFTLTRSSN